MRRSTTTIMQLATMMAAGATGGVAGMDKILFPGGTALNDLIGGGYGPFPEFTSAQYLEEYVLIGIRESKHSSRIRRDTVAHVRGMFKPNWKKEVKTIPLPEGVDFVTVMRRVCNMGTRKLIAFRRGRRDDGVNYVKVLYNELTNAEDVETLKDLDAKIVALKEEKRLAKKRK